MPEAPAILRRLVLAGLVLLAACDGGQPDRQGGAGVLEDLHAAPLERLLAPRFGDLPEMRQRRVVRVLVTYDRTNFFFRDGEPRGFEYEMLRRFEQELNAGVGSGELRTQLAFVPVPFGQVLDSLVAGRGDIAAAGLTITPARSERVAFSEPYLENVSEIFVTSRVLDPRAPLEELTARPVVVPGRTSYVRHLRELGRRSGREIEVVEAASGLQSADLLELVSHGALAVTVVDEHVAEIWSRVYPDLVLRRDLPVHQGSRIAWAVRRESVELRAALSRFARRNRRGTLIGNVLFQRYYGRDARLTNPLGEAELGRLRQLEPIFRRHAERYGFDWLAIAAQAYAESGLRQDRRSRNGAIGVMQLLPRTAAAEPVGIADIGTPDANVEAGVRYMAHLRDLFSQQGIGEAERFDFALAAYNAGPTRVRGFRERARELSLDPDRWFRNVELAALEGVGQETVRYVARVNKYYVAYRLAREVDRRRRDAREAALPGSAGG